MNDKKSFTRNENNKDLGLLKQVWKQERLSLETRHEHSISVPDSTSLNHYVTNKTLQHNTFIKFERGDPLMFPYCLEPKIHYPRENTLLFTPVNTTSNMVWRQ